MGITIYVYKTVIIYVLFSPYFSLDFPAPQVYVIPMFTTFCMDGELDLMYNENIDVRYLKIKDRGNFLSA